MENKAESYLKDLSQATMAKFRERQEILSFDGYLEKLLEEPVALTRHSAQYIKDTFDHFGTSERAASGPLPKITTFNLFDRVSERVTPIVGGHAVQKEIYDIVESFSRIGFANKLILMHGPNGSSKTSTVESVCAGMADYSTTEEGAVYRFNWIFPTDKNSSLKAKGETGPIGFASSDRVNQKAPDTYAFLDETKIASKIHSEFKDNPFYLIPMPYREKWLRDAFSKKLNIPAEKVELPPHILLSGLSKKNQLILDNLIKAYDGDMNMALRHVQVERFYYSRQYRVGMASVEPQMTVDAVEKQLTMDSNIQNLPSILHNIRFHEAQGPLVEANRGLLEFSDMLKRPVEAFKYLLTTVEKEVIDLPSSTAHLDLVFFATTNEKHLDAFKTSPDFSSFRSRFELVTVPYLLNSKDEAQIYQNDVDIISKTKKVIPHSVNLLCQWAVMTRLKQPDPETYPKENRPLISRIDPACKLAIYEGGALPKTFNSKEVQKLGKFRASLLVESKGSVVYEGRFGASPREVRGILYRASQNPRFATLSPLAIFSELEQLVKDRSVYEFLQYESRGQYHDATAFIENIKNNFAEVFESELLRSMTLVEVNQYDILLERYISNVVGYLKNEKVYNKSHKEYEEPSKSLMEQVEKILGVTSDVERHRQGVLGKIAAFKIENKSGEINTSDIFKDYHQKIEKHYYEEKSKLIEQNFKAIMKTRESSSSVSTEEKAMAERTLEQLSSQFGYDEETAFECLRFLMQRKKK